MVMVFVLRHWHFSMGSTGNDDTYKKTTKTPIVSSVHPIISIAAVPIRVVRCSKIDHCQTGKNGNSVFVRVFVVVVALIYQL